MKALINYALQAYVANTTGQPGPNVGHGVGLAVGLAAMQTVQSICQHHFFYRSMMVGAMARSALISVIYRKSLVLSNKVLYWANFANVGAPGIYERSEERRVGKECRS